uniref:Uncharacterized protein n=1 Tax=Tanacetum cinerariifolium TaxID=118510 RepID=A0A6L2MF66_TANCI|nr:hypothetical protein [Tanacetum cinerariifolium]
MSYNEPPIPPTGVNQQEPVEATTDTEPQNSDDIHPPTVQAKVQVDKPVDEPVVDKNCWNGFYLLWREFLAAKVTVAVFESGRESNFW